MPSSVDPTVPDMSSRIHWSLVPAARLVEHAEAWDRLNADTIDSPLLAASFILEALTQFGDGAEMLALGHDDEGLAAACLLRKHGLIRVCSFDPSQLPLCPWLQRPSLELSVLLSGLMQALPRHVMLLSLTGLDPLGVAPPRRLGRTTLVPHIVTGCIELSDDLASYWASRSRKFMSNVRRRTGNAQQALGVVDLDVVVEPEAMESGVRDYATLEVGGWKGTEDTAVAVGGRQYDFYLNSLRQMARIGEARVLRLRIGGRIAALQLALVRGSTMYLLKTTHDESLREFAPGVLAKSMLIDTMHKAEPAIRRIEFYGRLSEWQRPFVTSSRETYHLNYFRSSIGAWVHSRWSRSRASAELDTRED